VDLLVVFFAFKFLKDKHEFELSEGKHGLVQTLRQFSSVLPEFQGAVFSLTQEIATFIDTTPLL
jgi:hypothetical protein